MNQKIAVLLSAAALCAGMTARGFDRPSAFRQRSSQEQPEK